MIDNEIIKALEWCEQFEHNIVFKGNGDEKCVQALQMMVVIKHALKEYNRQKAENKELMEDNADLNETVLNLLEKIKTIKSEAIKEFAERLKTTDLSSTVGEHYINGEMYGYFDSGGFGRIIDNLVKEMTGDSFTKIEHNSLCETETYEGRGVYERKVSDT